MEEKQRLIIHYKGLVLPSQRVLVFHLLHYHEPDGTDFLWSTFLPYLPICKPTMAEALLCFLSPPTWLKEKNLKTRWPRSNIIRGVAPNFLRAVDADMVESERTQKFWGQERLGWESLNFSQRLLRTKHCWKKKDVLAPSKDCVLDLGSLI